MECWEFLIQQEGEDSWTEIPTKVMAIAQGNYKMLGKSNLPNTAIEVRLSHQNPDNPMVTHSRKRLRQTNKDGLVVIFTPTNLTPGSWQIACYDAQNSEFLGGLELQVFPAIDLNLEPELLKEVKFQLTLDHHTFVRTTGDNLTVSGMIESNLNEERVLPLTLSYELTNPQTAEIVCQVEQKLWAKKFPFTFTSSLKLDKDSASYLILGEAIIKAGSYILVSQPFSITADANQLLEAVHLPEFSQLLSKRKPSTIPTLIKVKPCEPIEDFPISSGQVLPPKIIRTYHLKHSKLPTLPPIKHSSKFPTQSKQEPCPLESVAEEISHHSGESDKSVEQSLNLLTESRFVSKLNSLVAQSK